jgi:hypothetical protein
VFFFPDAEPKYPEFPKSKTAAVEKHPENPENISSRLFRGSPSYISQSLSIGLWISILLKSGS